jgi:hypothetical protein
MKKSNRAFNSPLYPLIITETAMTKFLVESTNFIYTNYALKDSTPIFIQSLYASFISKNKDFNLLIDSVRAIKIKDAIIFNDRQIPSYSFYLSADTLKVKVKCLYWSPTNSDSAINCLYSNYEIYSYTIIQNDQYSPCH